MTHRTLVPLYSLFALALAGCELNYDGDCADAGIVDVDTAGTSGPPADCPADMLCFRFDAPLARDARLAVVWSQLDLNDPDPKPHIALDVPLYSGQRSVRFPTGSVEVPSDEALFYCARDCDDESVCKCLGEERFATATVVIAADENADGRIDADEAVREIGLARMMVGYSDVRQSPASGPLEGIVKGDVEEGVRPYSFVREDDGTYRIRHEDDGRTFHVWTCEDADLCDLELPQLRAH